MPFLTPSLRRPALAAALTGLLLVAAACGNSKPTVERKITKLAAQKVPTDMLGLKVQSESTKQAEGLKRPFIDGVALYSLRKGPLLEATLEIGRFSPDAKYKEKGFQGSVVSQIGTTTPQQLRMGERTVYLTSGRGQVLSVWFRDRYFFILTTRDDYKTPRSLLRTALDVQL